MSIADDLRWFAESAIKDAENCVTPRLSLFEVIRLRAHAETIERVVREMRAIQGWWPKAQAEKWADALEGKEEGK